MKRSEIHDAAKEFVRMHANYITEWASCWERAMNPFDPNFAVVFTNGVHHPNWDKLTPEEIVDFFNLFWTTLPDHAGIRGFGFGALCDIAEHVFGFDDEDQPEPTTEDETVHKTEA